MTNGWGPVERDLSNGEQAQGDGHPITLNGVTFAKGLGAHAASDVRYAIGGCTRFQSSIGVDDEVGANGSIVFQVYLDGVKAYDSGLMTGATATKTIDLDTTGKSALRLVITNGGDNVDYDHGDWAGATVTCGSPPPPTTAYLSDLGWTSMTNGWGPVERDLSNGEQAQGDGHTITLNGVTFAKGLGTHAASDVRYTIGGCTRFQASLGVDDEVGPNGSVDFQVYLDGVKAYDSGLMLGNSLTAPLDLVVTGKSQLRLVVTNGGDGINYDHADWADARLTCG